MNTAELIALLGVPDAPTTGEVRLARRRVAKRLHPDLGGDALTRAMADVNAGCDRLIVSIRAGRRRPPAVAAGPAPSAAQRAVFRTEYAIATVCLMGIVFGLFAGLLGGGATAVAAGLLFAALAGAAFVAVLLRVVERR